MPSETQAAFFSRITAALDQRGPTIDLPEDLETARVAGEGVDLVGTFVQRAQQAGMHPHRVDSEEAAADKVLEIARSLSVRTAIVPDEPIPGREAIVAALTGAGVKLPNPDDQEAPFTADIGITGVRLAVAETASMSVVTGEGHRRLASLAVPSHIAVLRADQIIPDLLDWGRTALTEPPANEVLISAMSKTADIEGILVPGVHGPGLVHVVIVG